MNHFKNKKKHTHIGGKATTDTRRKDIGKYQPHQSHAIIVSNKEQNIMIKEGGYIDAVRVDNNYYQLPDGRIIDRKTRDALEQHAYESRTFPAIAAKAKQEAERQAYNGMGKMVCVGYGWGRARAMYKKACDTMFANIDQTFAVRPKPIIHDMRPHDKATLTPTEPVGKPC